VSHFSMFFCLCLPVYFNFTILVFMSIVLVGIINSYPTIGLTLAFFLQISLPSAAKHLNNWNLSKRVQFLPHNVACEMKTLLFYFPQNIVIRYFIFPAAQNAPERTDYNVKIIWGPEPLVHSPIMRGDAAPVRRPNPILSMKFPVPK